MIDDDFERALQDFYASRVPSLFPFLGGEELLLQSGNQGWDRDISAVLARSDLSIDPKRWCERTVRTRQAIEKLDHFPLRKVLTVIPEERRPARKDSLYRYVEIQDIMDGIVKPTNKRGWDLPQRAKHGAEAGDIFVGKIWGSINKWFLAGGDCESMLVSNGTYRLRMKPEFKDYLPDVIAGLNTEAYRIQARAFCTGSDGLAELQEDDLLEIVLPRITVPSARSTIQKIVDDLLSGRATITGVVGDFIDDGRIPSTPVTPRSNGWVQV
jgi:type I restriction enzyme M protein